MCMGPALGRLAAGMGVNLLNPDDEDGEVVSLAVAWEPYDESDALITGSRREAGTAPGFRIRVDAVGSHTGITITLRMPLRASTYAGLVRGDLTLADFRDALGADSITDAGTYYELTWSISSMADETQYIDCRVGEVGSWFWSWEFGSSGVFGAYPYINGEGLLTGSSNEATADADGFACEEIATDIECDVSTSSGTVTEGDPIAFSVRQASGGHSGHYSNSVTIQITDAVTCSEPTLTSNPNGWTIGPWTSPGGGVQWQCIISQAGTIAAGTAEEVQFSTTPSGTGTWIANVSATAVENTVAVADTDSVGVTVEASYPVDSGSGQPYFASNADWQAIMAAGGVTISDLTHLHNCQEGSGNLAPAEGGLTLTANASPLYGQTFPGWSDIVAVAGDSSTSNQRFLNSSGPNASTTDMLIIVLMAWWGYSASVRGIVGGNNGIGSTGASGFPRAQYRAGSAAATPTSYALNTPYWMLWLCDSTNNRFCLYSRLEAYESSGYSPTNTTSYGLGGFGLATFAPVYIARFASIVGAGARISKATAHGVLSALGESMSWSP